MLLKLLITAALSVALADIHSDAARGYDMLVNDPIYHAPIIESLGSAAEVAGTTPVVIAHGMGDSGTNPGMKSICATVGKKYPGKFTLCSTTADSMSSIMTSMPKQVEEFAAEVRSHPELANGFHAVGLSQGNVLIEGYIALVNDPPVKSFVSICGPLQGEGTCPDNLAFKLVCPLWKIAPYGSGIAFSGYWKDVSDQSKYLAKSPFLAQVLNEGSTKNATIASNFKNLDNLVLIEATKDTMIVPKESEQHGFWAWGGDKSTIVPMEQSDGYKGDWIGLKTLDAANKIHKSSFVGEHIRFNSSYWDTVVLPYLAN